MHAEYRAAGEPSLNLLVGTHRASRLGPFWMRRPATLFLAATGMPGWWGKEFRSPESPEATTLPGHNLREADGRVVPSLAMTTYEMPFLVAIKAGLSGASGTA